jgi:hypothetical protein
MTDWIKKTSPQRSAVASDHLTSPRCMTHTSAIFSRKSNREAASSVCTSPFWRQVTYKRRNSHIQQPYCRFPLLYNYGIECPYSRRFRFRILVRTQLIHEPLGMHIATRNADVEKDLVPISVVLAYQGKQGTPDTYPVQWPGLDKPAGWLAGGLAGPLVIVADWQVGTTASLY